MRLRVKVKRDHQGQFLAFCPALPGCTSRGQTAHEALQQFMEYSQGYLAAVNNFVPERIHSELVEA